MAKVSVVIKEESLGTFSDAIFCTAFCFEEDYLREVVVLARFGAVHWQSDPTRSHQIIQGRGVPNALLFGYEISLKRSASCSQLADLQTRGGNTLVQALRGALASVEYIENFTCQGSCARSFGAIAPTATGYDTAFQI